MDTKIISDINLAAQHLNQGELVAIPTETVYGLAGNALNPDTLLKIYETKQRPAFDPLIIHFSDIGEIEKFVLEFPAEIEKLARKFMPGPLTIVLPKKDIIPDIATSGLPNVAIRIPNHPLTLQLLKKLDFPVAAPSANLFGKISPTSANHVNKQLSGKIEYILDGGSCPVGIESTIITQSENEIRVLRLGGLSIDDIQENTGLRVVHEKITKDINAPGQIKSHYATQTPLIFEGCHFDLRTRNIGYLRFSKPFPGISGEQQIVLSENASLKEAAKNLFKSMHQLDEGGYHFILAEKFPETGLGKAINDRLKRASINC
jgi:L-threonylcarbamoyladenylate synthase